MTYSVYEAESKQDYEYPAIVPVKGSKVYQGRTYGAYKTESLSGLFWSCYKNGQYGDNEVCSIKPFTYLPEALNWVETYSYYSGNSITEPNGRLKGRIYTLKDAGTFASRWWHGQIKFQ